METVGSLGLRRRGHIASDHDLRIDYPTDSSDLNDWIPFEWVPGPWKPCGVTLEDTRNFYTPNVKTVVPKTIHEERAPSAKVKAAVHWLVLAEFVQQVTGWLLLTLLASSVGAFGQIMPPRVCLISIAISVVEAILKPWRHRSYLDVPCASLPLRTGALSQLEVSLKLVAPLELALCVCYLYFGCHYLIDNMCTRNDLYNCQEGETTVVWLIIGCSVIAFVHGVMMTVMVLVAWWMFNSSIATFGCGMGDLSCDGHLSAAKYRILCLSWWVHCSRHEHLSAVEANKEFTKCKLPGHWFDTAEELNVNLGECINNMVKSPIKYSEGPFWDDLIMMLNTIIFLTNEGTFECDKILRNGRFNQLIQIVWEEKFLSCRRLAATAIGIVVLKWDKYLKFHEVNLPDATISLKKLAYSKEDEWKEVALGALLNIELTSHILSDEDMSTRDYIFMHFLVENVCFGPTMKCQELAIGLLTCLARRRPDAFNFFLDGKSFSEVFDDLKKDGNGGGKIDNLAKLSKHGFTAEVRKGAWHVLMQLLKYVAVQSSKDRLRPVGLTGFPVPSMMHVGHFET